MISFSFSDQTFQTQRVIGNIVGQVAGPAVLFVGGIHGNEPSGVVALQQVFSELEAEQTQIRGNLIGVTGNLPALSKNQRFISKDLNRLWTRDSSPLDESSVRFGDSSVIEHQEQSELFEIIKPLIERDGKTYFVDLHTTSAATVPFIAINDQLDNRNFALQFPVPTVLGIEEYLEGPLLSYLNDFGPVALAFEAGQHDDPESVVTHKCFIYQALVTAGLIDADQIPGQEPTENFALTRLKELGQKNHAFYEVIFRKSVSPEDEFRMKPGFRNLAPIKKGELIAHDRKGEIRAPNSGRIFMPLYQSSGSDGFFIVRQIPKWALVLSSLLRRFNFEKVLLCLPGVSRDPRNPETLVVNKKIARFLATQIFHLLGYRRKKDDGKVMIFSRREIAKR